MAYIQTEDSRVAREITTRGLAAVNAAELHKHRNSRNMTKRLIQQRLVAEAKSQALEARVARCELLLTELTSHTSFPPLTTPPDFVDCKSRE